MEESEANRPGIMARVCWLLCLSNKILLRGQPILSGSALGILKVVAYEIVARVVASSVLGV